MVPPASHRVSRVPWYSGSELVIFSFYLQDYYLLRWYFPVLFNYNSLHFNALSATPKINLWFGLFPFRSPLLRKSIFLSLPLGT